jgi:hypothetical protein
MISAADGALVATLDAVDVDGETAVARFAIVNDGVTSALAVPFAASRLAAGSEAASWAHFHRLTAALASLTADMDAGVEG